MLQFLPVFDGNTIAIRASGKLTHEDYQQFLPQLEQEIKSNNKLSMLLELDNFKGWELEAAKDDFRFGMTHSDHFERIAIVGDKAWEHWMVSMAKPFMPVSDIRYFNRENLQQAWDWLREKDALLESAKQIQPYQNIAVGIDFSPFSIHACKRAIDIARCTQATLTLFHIVEEYVPYSYYGDSMSTYIFDPQMIIDQNQQHLEQAKLQMNNFVKNLESDFDLKTEVVLGTTESTLASCLTAQQTDLAIFGTKKKIGLSQLLGSVPRYIQNHTDCEVLLVPFIDASF